MSLFRTKSIEALTASAESTHGLRRVLGPMNLISLGIGAIIGTGIFVLTGQAAAANAGPAIVLSMVVAGVVSALAALCYAEFAVAVPVAGSAYTYAYATLGEFVAWIIGWDLILEYALGAATVAVGWSGNVVSLLADFGVRIPAAISAAPGTMVMLADGGTATAVFNLPAVLIAVFVTAAAHPRRPGIGDASTRWSSRSRSRSSCSSSSPARRSCGRRTTRRSFRRTPGTFGEFGWSGILRGAAVIFFAYIGFDAVSTAAQEARDPQRDMPRGILGSLAICTVLYVLVSAVMVGLVPYRELGGPAPMAVAVDHARDRRAGHGVGRPHARHGDARQDRHRRRPDVDDGGADAGAAAHLHGDGAGRPAAGVGRPHPPALPDAAPHDARHRRRSSRVAAGFTPISVLGNLVSIGTLFAFVIVSIGVLVLRRTQPDLPRPFRTPWVPVVPIASAVVSFAPDAQPAGRDVGAAGDLDGDRRRALLRVRTSAIADCVGR